MSVLTAAQEAAVELNQLGQTQSNPASLFSTTDAFARELALQANRAAADILKAHEWQKLKLLCTLTGDASKLAFDLPADYDRMLKDGEIHSKSFKTATFRAVRDEVEWIYIQDTAVTGLPGSWIILGGQMQIYPAMSASETARFYYISNKIVTAADATKKTAFTADSDTFILSERLLALGMAWRWLSSKRLEYSEAMANYEKALAEEIGPDKGAHILTVGTQRYSGDVSCAYPGILG